MLLEGLLVMACVSGDGCSQTTTAYYRHNLEAKQMIDSLKRGAKDYAKENDWVMYTIAPAYTLAVGKAARFKIAKGIIFKADVRDKAVALEWTF